MNVTAQKFQSLYALVCKSLAWRNHRTTLPQSRPLGVPAPSEREPGDGLCHSTEYSLKSQVTGDFHRPYENSEVFTFHHSTDDTPSVTPCGRASSLREGAGVGLAPSIRVLAEIRGWRAIFIAPTKRKGFDIVPFNRVLAEIRGGGRFSSPLRKLCFLHFSVWCPHEKSGGIFRRFLGGDYVAAAFKGRMGARVEMACL